MERCHRWGCISTCPGANGNAPTATLTPTRTAGHPGDGLRRSALLEDLRARQRRSCPGADHRDHLHRRRHTQLVFSAEAIRAPDDRGSPRSHTAGTRLRSNHGSQPRQCRGRDKFRRVSRRRDQPPVTGGAERSATPQLQCAGAGARCATQALRAIDQHGPRRPASTISTSTLCTACRARTPPADADGRCHHRARVFSPPHLSWYQLTIEPNTVFQQTATRCCRWRTHWPISRIGVRALLAECGNDRQYEVSAYSQAGRFQCRHNLNYWALWRLPRASAQAPTAK